MLGQNKGWKNGMEMGPVQNRRFSHIPIARLIELIRYKAQALGLVVVTTEESCTRKTSFVSDEPLKNISEERKRAKKQSGLQHAAKGVYGVRLPCEPDPQIHRTPAQPPIGADPATDLGRDRPPCGRLEG